MVKIAICDDSVEDIELTKKELNIVSQSLQYDFKIYEFTDDKIMAEDIISHEIDIVLLDIDMPSMSGMDIANKLTKEKPFINI